MFTTATATYQVTIDVERGFSTALPGETDIVKQVFRCKRDGSNCTLVAQEVGPLADGESFTITTDHKARLKARWLGYPLVLSWDRYARLPESTGKSLTFAHDNWTEEYLNFSHRFMTDSYQMLGSTRACPVGAGLTITSLAAGADRAEFATKPLPPPSTLVDLRRTKGRCPK